MALRWPERWAQEREPGAREAGARGAGPRGAIRPQPRDPPSLLSRTPVFLQLL